MVSVGILLPGLMYLKVFNETISTRETRAIYFLIGCSILLMSCGVYIAI